MCRPNPVTFDGRTERDEVAKVKRLGQKRMGAELVGTIDIEDTIRGGEDDDPEVGA